MADNRMAKYEEGLQKYCHVLSDYRRGWIGNRIYCTLTTNYN
jgi:hypothetical protein